VVRRIMRSPDEGRPVAGVVPRNGHDRVASSVACDPHDEAAVAGLTLRTNLNDGGSDRPPHAIGEGRREGRGFVPPRPRLMGVSFRDACDRGAGGEMGRGTALGVLCRPAIAGACGRPRRGVTRRVWCGCCHSRVSLASRFATRETVVRRMSEGRGCAGLGCVGASGRTWLRAIGWNSSRCRIPHRPAGRQGNRI